ncbi:MAG: pectin esterase [Prevotella sp.]|nr:pectin esterase [Prevotella sp.]
MKRNFLLLICFLAFCISAQARGKYDNIDTLVVAKDDSGEFKTINEAIEVCRAFMEYKKVIFIKKGIYKEKVIIPSWLTNIEIIGEERDNTVITYDDHANVKRMETGLPMGTFRTYTVKIEGSSITFRNITIENNAEKLGQAVALHTEGDKLTFINCRILGNQDTIYTGVANTRLYFRDCLIEGTTDFIFGPSTAWFENCEIRSRVNSYITAASTPKDVKYGYIFNKCQLTAYEGVDKVFLGRPWRAYAHTLFINCDLGRHIVPEGWQNWKDYHDPAAEGTVRYQEYNNHGKGANPKARTKWSRQLTKKEATKITLKEVFHLEDNWIPE